MKKKDDSPSSEPEFEIINDDVVSTAEVVDDSLGAVDEGAAQNEALQAQVAKLTNDYLYLRAEFDNYRRQAIKERSDMVKYAGERLAKDFLETLDIFETALATEVNADNLPTFVTGIQMTAQQLRSVLQKHGIQEVPAEGLAFDPTVHEALGSEPTDEIPPGHVSKVFKKAYKYHEKVLRPAQVIVAKEKNS